MANIKYVKISKKKIEGYIKSGQLFTKSNKTLMSSVQQYNSLSTKTRTEIVNEWNQREKIIKKKMDKYPNNEELYVSLIGIELHKIAALFDIQPDTVVLCISKVCDNNKKIIVT